MPAGERSNEDLKRWAYPGGPSAGPAVVVRSSGVRLLVEFNLPLLVRVEARTGHCQEGMEKAYGRCSIPTSRKYAVMEIVGMQALSLEQMPSIRSCLSCSLGCEIGTDSRQPEPSADPAKASQIATLVRTVAQEAKFSGADH